MAIYVKDHQFLVKLALKTQKPKNISRISCCHNMKFSQEKKTLIMNVCYLNIINFLQVEGLVDGIALAHDK